MRFTGTVGGTEPTYAAEELTIDGIPIPRGALVVPLLAAANRDPAVFVRPDEFDITREPNPHLAFSKGTHFCVGAALARPGGPDRDGQTVPPVPRNLAGRQSGRPATTAGPADVPIARPAGGAVLSDREQFCRLR